MRRTALALLPLLIAVAGCSERQNLTSILDPPQLNQQAVVPSIVNGSFETGDYTGWTLWEGNSYHNPVCGTWGIAEDGQTIVRLQYVWDFFDGILISQQSMGLPETYGVSDGTYAAFQLQNCAEKHRMFQDVFVPSGAILSWDMKYTNYRGQFNARQWLEVTVRDPMTDGVIETLFLTVDGTTPQSIGMTTFTADLSTYAGQTVRIDVELTTYEWFFHATFDNFVITTPASRPPGWKEGKKVGWPEDAMVPPGLERRDIDPYGYEQGNKEGWEQ